jgi:uncharacterized protein YndB with AHSA1/START domain
VRVPPAASGGKTAKKSLGFRWPQMSPSRKAARRPARTAIKKTTKAAAPKRKAAPKRAAVAKAPPAPKTPPVIQASIEIHAPAHRVWAALTSPDEVNRWFTDRCEFEARPNGRVLYAWFGAEGNPPAYVAASRHGLAAEARIETWEPRRSFSLRPTTRWPGLVTFRLEELPDRTRLQLMHEGWPEKDEWYRAHEKGWTEALDLLKHYLEKPEAEFDAYLAKVEARSR